MGVDPYFVLSDEAALAGVGAEGLFFLPYLTGERTPHFDPHAKGAWIGLTVRHGRAHMVRSILEGASYAMRDCLELVRAMGVTVEQIRASGGGARNPLWRQIQADIYGIDVDTVNSTEGPAFGVALLAQVGTGAYSTVPEACDATISDHRQDRDRSAREGVLRSGIRPLSTTLQGLETVVRHDLLTRRILLSAAACALARLGDLTLVSSNAGSRFGNTTYRARNRAAGNTRFAASSCRASSSAFSAGLGDHSGRRPATRPARHAGGPFPHPGKSHDRRGRPPSGRADLLAEGDLPALPAQPATREARRGAAIARRSPKLDYARESWKQEPPNKAAFAHEFMEYNASDYFELFTRARLWMPLFSVIGGLAVFFWSRALYGNLGGLLSLALWIFCPNILAHTRLVTTDMGATSLGALATFVFWLFLKRPSWSRTCIAGVCLGLAQLTKFSLLLLYGVWPILALASEAHSRADDSPSDRSSVWLASSW